MIRIYSVGVWNENINAEKPKTRGIRIYSVGVWNGLKFADIEISSKIRIYSVGVWNQPFGKQVILR